MENSNKSKYLRDKNEPKKSKYIRGKDEEKEKSIYKKDGENKEYKSGRERYEAYLEHDKEKLEELESESIPGEAEAPVEEAAAENKDNNDAAKSLFKEDEKNKKLKGNITSGRINEKPKVRLYARMVFCCAVIEFAAVVLQVFKFRVPLTPLPLTMDLSAIPELLAAVAYGPVVGIAVTLLKNVFYILIFHKKVIATALSNTMLDSVFVIIASLIYTRGMFSPRALERKREKERLPKRKRSKQIIKSGLLGAVITTVLTFFSVNYVVLPLIFKQFGKAGHTEEAYLQYYQNAIDTIAGYLHINPIHFDSLMQGTLVFNMPMTLGKLIVVTIVVAFIYRYLSDFLHYRNKKKK